MAANVGKLVTVVTASAGGLFAGLTQAQLAIKQFGSTATQVASAAGVALGGLSVAGAAGWALDLAANLERTQMQFGVLIGNAQQASSILGQLREFDIVSPLGLDTLLSGTKTMLQFGVATQQVVPIAKMLGDVSMGNASSFSSLALVWVKLPQPASLPAKTYCNSSTLAGIRSSKSHSVLARRWLRCVSVCRPVLLASTRCVKRWSMPHQPAVDSRA
jgi:hypothetical protein